jgi:xanthine dehydrogenase accessory factor
VIIIKGAGDLASGTALRLFHAGFEILMTETKQPAAVRRTVSFCRAVYEGSAQVEDITAVLTDSAGIAEALRKKQIPVIIDPEASSVRELQPAVLIDAIMAKRNTGTRIEDAPLVIGLGPGFTAGFDCHAVIETKRGHTLGRVITQGSAIPNTGIPGDIGGFTRERLLVSAGDGIFEAKAEIGDLVKKGGVLGVIHTSEGNEIFLRAEIDGVLRGLLPSGIPVHKGMKAGDIDPRCEKWHCFTVSDKALAIAGGVLEAALRGGFLPAASRFAGKIADASLCV